MTIDYTYDAAGNLLTREITAGGQGDPTLNVLNASVKQNKKTAGQKAKIARTCQMASDKDLAQGLVVTVGNHTQALNPPDLIEKGMSWEYKRPKGQPKQGIKKAKIKWNRKGDFDKGAVNVAIAIDDAAIFAGGTPVNVDVSLQNGTNENTETTVMMQKKAGKLKYKAQGGRNGSRCVTIVGAQDACFIHVLSAKPGQRYHVSVWTRSEGSKKAHGRLVVQWKDVKGAWVCSKPRREARLSGGLSEWRRLSLVFTVPDGVGRAVVLLAAKDQGADDAAYFDDVRVVKLPAGPDASKR